MTNHENETERRSRRSFLRTGALLSGGLAVGDASAEGGRGNPSRQGRNEVLLFRNELRPGARFYVVSPAIRPTPDLEGAPERVLRTHDVRVAEYLSDGRKVLLLLDTDVSIEQGPIYELGREFAPYGGDDRGGLRRGSFELVRRARIVGLNPGGDMGFQGDEDFEQLEGGGKALVRARELYPRSHVRIVSERIPDPPSDTVEGSGIFSAYDMWLGEYWGTNYQFPIYPAHEAEVQRREVYWMIREADATDPEGRLRTVNLSRVDESSLIDRIGGS